MRAMGSNPRSIARLLSNPYGAWRSLVSALVWGTRGPEFKSRRPDQKTPCSEGVFRRGSVADLSDKPHDVALQLLDAD
jgi:hypothetical protein